MKPTKEIIELAKKLHELGYRQVIKNGDWMIGSLGYLCLWSGDAPPINSVSHNECLPIPSLEDGLEWLKENDQYYVLLDSVSLKTRSTYVVAKTPHEAVLKSMIKVLEQ